MTGLLGNLEAMVPALRRYAGAMLPEQGQADEVIQACMAEAIDRLRSPLNEAELRVRLFGAVYSRLTNRSRFRRPRGAPSSARATGSPVAPTELTRALGRLSLEQRSVIFLISVEDLPYAAVAEVMSMSVTAIMSLLAGGREQLRQSVGSAALATPQRVS